MLKYQTVNIAISELHTQQATVPAWEVPLLEAVHNGAIEVVSESLVNREAPDPEVEFQRLTTRYKTITEKDGSKGLPFVATVYGQFGVGTRALGKAIADAVVEAPTETAYIETVNIDDLLGGIEL